MIYGELGLFPIVLDMKYRTISYWIKLIENASSDNVKLYFYPTMAHIERTSDTNLYKHSNTSFGISNYINILDKSRLQKINCIPYT